MKINHKRIGFISNDGKEITGYGHERHSVGECPWCDFLRASALAEEFIRRMEVCNERFEHLNMWSLGTSMGDTIANRKRILQWWRKFTVHFNKYESWSALFRVVEVGSRGLLHIHFVCSDYLPHQKVLVFWRALTGEKSNVHVSGQKGAQDPKKLIHYLTKYLTKSTTSYRWLGAFHGVGGERGRKTSTRPPDSTYGGVVYGGYDTEGYKAQGGSERLPTPIVSKGRKVIQNGKRHTVQRTTQENREGVLKD